MNLFLIVSSLLCICSVNVHSQRCSRHQFLPSPSFTLDKVCKETKSCANQCQNVQKEVCNYVNQYVCTTYKRYQCLIQNLCSQRNPSNESALTKSRSSLPQGPSYQWKSNPTLNSRSKNGYKSGSYNQKSVPRTPMPPLSSDRGTPLSSNSITEYEKRIMENVKNHGLLFVINECALTYLTKNHVDSNPFKTVNFFLKSNANMYVLVHGHAVDKKQSPQLHPDPLFHSHMAPFLIQPHQHYQSSRVHPLHLRILMLLLDSHLQILEFLSRMMTTITTTMKILSSLKHNKYKSLINGLIKSKNLVKRQHFSTTRP
ncbi:unnamed protein product [Lepeophtheirus salmonis]|uniref:(salmon louse) hypothetical protein n=1 Tax=Lepeophtheirus salmonis TaxID=72036 RepID=A0A7R8CSJ0_LEPSM|nr:unnamed protein product [Lepeophtheirus salmonis]CAF2917425.1 unnamed protein product [Lepeophtheirus salmonis]